MQKPPGNYHQITTPVEFTLGGQTWRIAYFAQMQEPDGRHVLACTAVMAQDATPAARPRGMSDELHTMATAVAGIIADFSCCDRHADERMLQLAGDMLARMRAGRAWNAANPAGKPN